MSIRVGGLLVVTGLALALALGPIFVVVGLSLAVCGGIVAAVGMESAVAHEHLDATAALEPVSRDRTTKSPH